MYPHLFLAGTFDGLHAGHEAVLSEAFARGRKVTIGLTSDLFVQKSKVPAKRDPASRDKSQKSKVRGYQERKSDLELWLENRKRCATIIPIDDPYEPAASMKDLDALIVTAENRATGEHINALRQGLALSRLSLIEVPIVPAEDGKSVSSTRMRNGEIDSDGRLIMPESMRGALGKPMGRVLTETEVDRLLRSHPASQGETLRVTVGDIATKTFLDAGITPTLAIIDGMVGRKPFHETLKILQPQRVSPFEAKGVKSGPGYISREAVKTIQTMLNSPSPPLTLRGGMGGVTPHHVLIIDGEEDLLVLPAILHAPLESILYYGQPGEGLVEVVVTEGKKEEVRRLINRFIQSDK